MLQLAERIDPGADRALTFANDILRGQSAAFYEVSPDLTLDNYILRDVSLDFHRQYLDGMGRYDPLHIRHLAGRGRSVARLAEECRNVPSADYASYRRFSSYFGVSDMLEFVFRREGRIFAGMSVTWSQEKHIPDAPLNMASHIHAYLEYNLLNYRRAAITLPNEKVKSPLARFGLTPRELEVAELLCCGRTNGEIGECFGISLATVKTHLVHIFCKLGVETRSAVVAMAARAK